MQLVPRGWFDITSAIICATRDILLASSRPFESRTYRLARHRITIRLYHEILPGYMAV